MSEFQNKTDTDYLHEINIGSENAIDALIMKYKPIVETIAMKYINTPLEIEDLVQEGMIGLLAAIKSYSPDKGTAFSTYANICINNSIKTALQKFSRMKAIPQENIVTLEESSLDAKVALSAEDEYLAKESVNALTDILYEGLSRFENEVLRLHIVGCSYNEIADKLGKNPKAIDNAIQRIRKKLNGVAF